MNSNTIYDNYSRIGIISHAKHIKNLLNITSRWQESAIFLVTIVYIIATISSIAFAADKKGRKTVSQTQIKETEQKELHITSDSMEVEKASSIVRFSGNVIVTQQTSVIHADTITLTLYSDEEKKKLSEQRQQDIKMMVASGNVQFSSQDQKATADKAIYTARDQTLVLTGSAPKVLTGDSFVTGKKITLHQDSGKVVVEGDHSKRVEAFFNRDDTVRFEGEF